MTFCCQARLDDGLACTNPAAVAVVLDQALPIIVHVCQDHYDGGALQGFFDAMTVRPLPS